ncbi:MAG: DNA alkylation repair protein, partial [Muribaculaceae bacterium]|nr:DNA alkylation repair protein [Muribaculaceae bacterium]
IFGLNIPQIADIARDFGPDRKLADQLRENIATRESLLIAPMIFPREELTQEIARDWLSTAMTPEVIDIACLKLIRYLPEAGKLIEELYKSDKDLDRYAALRLGANSLPDEMDLVEQCAKAEAERQLPLTFSMSMMLLDDISWRREEAAEEEGLEESSR